MLPDLAAEQPTGPLWCVAHYHAFGRLPCAWLVGGETEKGSDGDDAAAADGGEERDGDRFVVQALRTHLGVRRGAIPEPLPAVRAAAAAVWPDRWLLDLAPTHWFRPPPANHDDASSPPTTAAATTARLDVEVPLADGPAIRTTAVVCLCRRAACLRLAEWADRQARVRMPAQHAWLSRALARVAWQRGPVRLMVHDGDDALPLPAAADWLATQFVPEGALHGDFPPCPGRTSSQKKKRVGGWWPSCPETARLRHCCRPCAASPPSRSEEQRCDNMAAAGGPPPDEAVVLVLDTLAAVAALDSSGGPSPLDVALVASYFAHDRAGLSLSGHVACHGWDYRRLGPIRAGAVQRWEHYCEGVERRLRGDDNDAAAAAAGTTIFGTCRRCGSTRLLVTSRQLRSGRGRPGPRPAPGAPTRA